MSSSSSSSSSPASSPRKRPVDTDADADVAHQQEQPPTKRARTSSVFADVRVVKRSPTHTDISLVLDATQLTSAPQTLESECGDFVMSFVRAPPRLVRTPVLTPPHSPVVHAHVPTFTLACVMCDRPHPFDAVHQHLRCDDCLRNAPLARPFAIDLVGRPLPIERICTTCDQPYTFRKIDQGSKCMSCKNLLASARRTLKLLAATSLSATPGH